MPEETYMPDKEEMLTFLTQELEIPERIIREAFTKYYGHDQFYREKKCFHCEANTLKYKFHIDALDARTMKLLGSYVLKQLQKGTAFTEANKIHMSGIGLTPNQCDRKTQLRYLGLIAKYKVEGVHKDSLWVITKRGYAFLRGESVPKTVTVWRKQIVDRSVERITLQEADLATAQKTEDGWDLACFDSYGV